MNKSKGSPHIMCMLHVLLGCFFARNMGIVMQVKVKVQSSGIPAGIRGADTNNYKYIESIQEAAEIHTSESLVVIL